MLSSPAIASLTAVIGVATTQATQLLATLEAEQQALLSEDYDHLEVLMGQKVCISQALDTAEQQRRDILQQAEEDTDSHAMQVLFAAHPRHGALQALARDWDTLLACLRKAADQNRLNGILLEKQRQHVKRALNILFEQSPNQAVYDASGGTAPPQYSRSVGVA
ncbi:MAG: flagellar protein FlgN [Gammaproteobacteria bacterium]